MYAYDRVQAFVHKTGNSDDNTIHEPSIDNNDTATDDTDEVPTTMLVNDAKSSSY